ncbi:MAG: hypothetical protein VKS61_11240 [Candidatus Sericytochromatia bacterium]|nr:hypothetical protein [Candidatus Sericytochromatia bacterium]
MEPIAPLGATPSAGGTSPLSPLPPGLRGPLPPKSPPRTGGTARAVAPGARGARAVVVVDGNPTWDALNAAVGAAEEMTAEEMRAEEMRAEEAVRAARALAATGPLNELENTSGTSAKWARIQMLSRRLRQLKVKRERLVEVMGRNGVLVKRARLGLGEMRDALRGATGPAATSMRSAVERMEAFIKRLENKMTEDQTQLSLLDRQIGDIEAELSALGG